MDKSVDIELEQTSIYVLLACFAAQLEYELGPPIITSSAEDYFLVARNAASHGDIVYDVEIWRTSEFEDVFGAIFSVAHAPGIADVSFGFNEWHSVPTNDRETQAVYGPMWGIQATFVYPEDMYELEALYDRAKDSF